MMKNGREYESDSHEKLGRLEGVDRDGGEGISLMLPKND